MIDFTELPTRKKAYAGANGGKIAVIYEGEQYMLKFPPPPKRNREMSYTNSCISEYLGCHIFEAVGIPVQKTMLGIYSSSGKEKVVVACKDFTDYDTVLQDFASLKNTLIDSGHDGYGTELPELIEAIEEQTFVDPTELKKRFWDMFIVDALIGNMDRHNGNWGFLYNTIDDTISIAPVYDCGSSLYPQADNSIMEKVLHDEDELKIRIYEFPSSAIFENGKRINYFEFISSNRNTDCTNALLRIYPRINIDLIYKLINDIDCISDLEKAYYKTIIYERYKRILEYSFKKIIN